MHIKGKRIGPLALAILLGFCCTAWAAPAPSLGSLEFIGNIWPSGVSEDSYFLRYWNQVTVENSGKWGNVEPERGRMQWQDLDTAYGFAQTNHIPFKLHTLVWSQAQPSWLGKLSAEEIRAAVEGWIGQLGERYPNVDMIDVVNEPLNAPASYAPALGGAGETRWDWVVTAFRMAREHFPNAKLGVNEYGTLGYADATMGYRRLVRVLKERGLIDYVGVQSHGLERVSPSEIASSLASLAEEGLPIYVSELDIGLYDDTEQAAKMRDLMTVFAANPMVRGVTFWGYRQEWIYRKSAYLLGKDGHERPALAWLREFSASLR